MRWLFKSLRGGVMTLCPLCSGPSQARRLCAGCYQDTYKARQQRTVCLSCAQSLADPAEAVTSPCTGTSSTDFRALAAKSVTSPCYCRVCQRQAPTHAWLICALDGGFPEALLLQRLSKPRADLSIAPLLADLMWQALCQQLEQHPGLICIPDMWIALPAEDPRLQSLQCNPAQELTNALARISGRRRLWQGVYVRQDATGVHWGARRQVAGKNVTLVLDFVHDLQVLEPVAWALRVAGAQQVGVIAAARNAGLWQNLTHVSCDPR